MGTVADLILKTVEFLMGERKHLDSVRRDQLDRVADYLERISDGLKEASEKLSMSHPPWREMREMAYQSNQLLSVLANVLNDDTLALSLREELEMAVHTEHVLVDGSVEQKVIDAFSLRPKGYMCRDWDDNPVRTYTRKQLNQIFDNEVQKIEEASGLFRAVAHELRARPI
jgi:hypothetical protein